MVRRVLIGALIIAVGALPARAVVTTFTASRDNTIYSEGGAVSNGQFAHLFAGRTTLEPLRRALLKFDVSTIPPGSTVTAVSVRMRCTMSSFINPTTATFTLRRVTADWGEAASASDPPGGLGAPAVSGDATWTERFFDQGQPWTTAGGDFSGVTSASFTLLAAQACTDAAPVTINVSSTPQLVNNVQAWVNSPASNFGWILIGDETDLEFGTARRFGSREHTTASSRPQLSVTYTLPPPVPGAVPDGDDVAGSALVLDWSGGQVVLDWDPSCQPGATDYAVYEGTLGDWYSHDMPYCSTGGLTTFALTPAVGDTYYLVVPVAAGQEGSYGRDGSDVERPQSDAACFVQDLVPLCP
jgi:hypothetical protein